MDARVSLPLVGFENVSLTLTASSGGATEVVRGLDLSIEPGEFVAVIGPSGCGKSTILSLLAGYRRPTVGNVLFDGRLVDGPGRERMMVFQQPALFPWLTAAGNVAYGLRLAANRSPREAVRRKVAEMLRLVGLEDCSGLYPAELSGGMCQRIEIARALAVDPKLLLMDEPLGALDALTRRTMQREVLRIWSETAKTIVFVTHDIDEAVILADRIVVMAPRPTFVLEAVDVRLPRPRRRDDRQVVALARRLADFLEPNP